MSGSCALAEHTNRDGTVDNAGPPALGVSSLEPDAFAAVCEHLRHRDVAALASSSSCLRAAVGSNDRLWSGLYSRQFPEHWQRLSRAQQQARGLAAGAAAGGWRAAFLATHAACQRLQATGAVSREWSTDSTPVHLVALHGGGPSRLALAAQGTTVELRRPPCHRRRSAAAPSVQLLGHTARVGAAAVLELAGPGGRVGVVTASHDQTVRLWAAGMDGEGSGAAEGGPLQLAAPLRTLRGHQEAVTSLQLVAGSAGVTIAATGSKDREVRLFGLAPLLPSPVQKPQIARLRGHGGPVTCLALLGGADAWHGSGSADGLRLLSGSLDGRVKSWDPWTAACSGTARLPAPVAAAQPAAACPQLQPHTLLVAAGGGVHLLDARSMRAAAVAALPAPAELRCFAQHGWDVVLGGGGGAHVFDLRALPPSAASAAAARAAHWRLRVASGHRPVTSIHLDRHKLVTATERYGEAPVRVWCPHSGDCLAEFGSCLDGEPAAGEQVEGQPGSRGDEADAGGGGDAWQGAEAVGGREQAQPQYQRGWEGVTALACRGAVLLTGSGGGGVCERDFSRGGLPESGGDAEGGGSLLGKFWQ